MAFNRNRLRGVIALAALATTAGLAACGDDDIDITRPQDATLESPLFESYVALGNSITAGYQSSGINDSTQRESYARYLAIQMGTPYRYASLAMPGCPPPIENFVTGARVGGGSATTCARRANITEGFLNNVAVPGATVVDPTAANTPFSNPLTLFIAGGKSQVTRALQADPTFVSAWIGNNDVLAAAVTGLITPKSIQLSATQTVASPGITDTNTFKTLYKRMVDSLALAPRLRGGVLIDVVNVTNAPVLFPAALLASPTFKAQFDLIVGKPVTVLANCTSTTKTLLSMQIISLLRAQATPTLSCERITGQPILGELFVLDSTELAAVTAAVTSYNTFIEAQATAHGWLSYDPNPDLAALRQAGAIPVFANFGDPANPFGQYISLDGAHPRRLAHKLVTNQLIKKINTKYGTAMDTIAVN